MSLYLIIDYLLFFSCWFHWRCSFSKRVSVSVGTQLLLASRHTLLGYTGGEMSPLHATNYFWW